MTGAQIQEILGVENLDQRIFFNEINHISFYGKDKNPLFSEINRTRFLFDSTNEILGVSYCRPYSQDLSKLPEHGQYDQLDYFGTPTIFEYLIDVDERLIIDYYSFESIAIIALRGV